MGPRWKDSVWQHFSMLSVAVQLALLNTACHILHSMLAV